MPTNTTEKGLESLIVEYLTSTAGGYVQGDPKDLHDTKVARPQPGEQAKIAQFLDHELVGLEQAINKVLRNIDVLREYPTRLIADVVAGKQDVRGVEMPAADETEALEDLDFMEAENGTESERTEDDSSDPFDDDTDDSEESP